MMSASYYQIDHVLSTSLWRSNIFGDLIARSAANAPAGFEVVQSVRPKRSSALFHYHRPNLERRLRAPAIVTVHHDLQETEPWLKLQSFLPRYREAAVVHCLNETQRRILRGHGIEHTRVIPHGVDRQVLPLPTGARRLSGQRLCLGIFARRYARNVKGEDLLERMLEHLNPARISFLLVGEDRWRDAAVVRAKGFAAEVYERPPYRLVGQLVARMDALLILSHFEGGPASLPEALGSGVPVLCTPVGMCPDWVRDGENGILLDREPKRMADHVMSLVAGDASAYDRLADGAFRTAPTIPDWTEIMQRWFALYRQALEIGET